MMVMHQTGIAYHRHQLHAVSKIGSKIRTAARTVPSGENLHNLSTDGKFLNFLQPFVFGQSQVKADMFR